MWEMWRKCGVLKYMKRKGGEAKFEVRGGEVGGEKG